MTKIKLNRGFTLFEIIVAIAIIFLLTALSTNLIIRNNNLYVFLEIERLYALALYLQKQAQIEQKTVKIFFDPNNHKYIVDSKEYKLSNYVKFGIIKNAKGPPSRPESKINKPITFQDRSMIFYPDGTISAGILYLTDKNEKVLYAISSGVSSISYLRRYKFNMKWILIN